MGLRRKSLQFITDLYQRNILKNKEWFVDSNLSTSGDGTTWGQAFITLAEAISAAGDYDTIRIREANIITAPAAGWTITQTGLKIKGENSHPGCQNAAIKITSGTASMFTITVNRVEICNLTLSQRTAYPCIKIGSDAQSTAGTAIYQTYIHDCNIEGYGTGTYGIAPNMSASTVDCVNLVVENCYFNSFATAAIYASGTRKSILFNTFIVPANTIGIYAADSGGDRAYTIIRDNVFTGVSGSTTKGIYFAGTPTDGTLILMRNLLCGTWNVTITDVTGGCENYVMDTNGGAEITC